MSGHLRKEFTLTFRRWEPAPSLPPQEPRSKTSGAILLCQLDYNSERSVAPTRVQSDGTDLARWPNRIFCGVGLLASFLRRATGPRSSPALHTDPFRRPLRHRDGRCNGVAANPPLSRETGEICRARNRSALRGLVRRRAGWSKERSPPSGTLSLQITGLCDPAGPISALAVNRSLPQQRVA